MSPNIITITLCSAKLKSSIVQHSKWLSLYQYQCWINGVANLYHLKSRIDRKLSSNVKNVKVKLTFCQISRSYMSLVLAQTRPDWERDFQVNMVLYMICLYQAREFTKESFFPNIYSRVYNNIELLSIILPGSLYNSYILWYYMI